MVAPRGARRTRCGITRPTKPIMPLTDTDGADEQRCGNERPFTRRPRSTRTPELGGAVVPEAQASRGRRGARASSNGEADEGL